MTKNSLTINIPLFHFLYCDTAFASADADYSANELCVSAAAVPLTAQAGIHPLTPLNLNHPDRNSCFMPLLISRTRIEDDFKEI